MSRLWAVSHVPSLDPGKLEQALGDGAACERRVTFLKAKGAAYEAELCEAIFCAANAEHAQALVNEVLWELEGRLSWGAMLPSVCARISLFGAMFAMALLLASEAKFSTELVDVAALGGSGTLVAMSVGREASRVAARTRSVVDQSVERLLRKRWLQLRANV
jgi:hypothetical protein